MILKLMFTFLLQGALGRHRDSLAVDGLPERGRPIRAQGCRGGGQSAQARNGAPIWPKRDRPWHRSGHFRRKIHRAGEWARRLFDLDAGKVRDRSGFCWISCEEDVACRGQSEYPMVVMVMKTLPGAYVHNLEPWYIMHGCIIHSVHSTFIFVSYEPNNFIMHFISLCLPKALVSPKLLYLAPRFNKSEQTMAGKMLGSV